jgi:hypothetical protein
MNNSAYEESSYAPSGKYQAISGDYQGLLKTQEDKLEKLRSSGNPELLKLFEEKYSKTKPLYQPEVLDNYLKHLNERTLPKKGFFQRWFGKKNPYDGGRGRKSRKGRRGRKSRKGRRGRKSRKR